MVVRGTDNSHRTHTQTISSSQSIERARLCQSSLKVFLQALQDQTSQPCCIRWSMCKILSKICNMLLKVTSKLVMWVQWQRWLIVSISTIESSTKEGLMTSMHTSFLLVKRIRAVLRLVKDRN